MTPKLQIALDNTTLEDALETCKALGDVVDVIEVGTILAVAEGAKAVKTIREKYPQKIVLADIKAADAGKVLADICYGAGATWMTVICSADIATMTSAQEVARKYHKDNDVQIELYGDWTFEHARKWKEAGLTQVVYHRSRDAQSAGKKWDESDLEKITKLNEMGFDVSVTGGISKEDLAFFKDLKVYAFIAGRSLRDADDPTQEAKDFKAEIQRIWG